MKPTRKRLVILALISTATLINYLDRSVMGVAKPELVKELHITPEVMGLIFSAFSWTYALAQIPGGYVLDRGHAADLCALAGPVVGDDGAARAGDGVAGLVSARLALGLAEAPCFPANSRVLSTWFPQNERAKATGVYTVGEYIGLGLLIPALGWMLNAYGWRSLFFVVGGLGVAFAFLFHRLYREPQDSSKPSRNRPDCRRRRLFRWHPAHRLQLGQCAAPCRHAPDRGCLDWSVLLEFHAGFLPDMVPVLSGRGTRHDLYQIGLAGLAALYCGGGRGYVGGVFSDWLIRATGSPTIGRKVPIIAGLLLCASMVSANYMDSNNAVIAVMSLAFFGQGLAGLGWTLLSDVAPKEMMGLTAGLFNFFTNLAGIITPLVVGFAVGATGSFYGALAYIGALGIIGTLAYLFILGPVERVKLN
jgi:ACS family D-galactonate transporter-like MFS transporter